MNLPYDLVVRCREVLSKCDEFESYETLRALFITPDLKPFRVGIPTAAVLNQTGRVNLFLEFILEETLTGGKPVFPVFLATLRDNQQKGDGRREALEQLLKEVQAQEQPVQISTSVSPLQHQALHEKLLTLDFRPQVRRFREVTDEHRVAAFLVHGPPQHGQRFLTRRLKKFRKEWGIGKLIEIEAGSNGVGKSSYALWTQVARHLDMPVGTDKHILAEKVCEWWKTQSVIFVFYSVDYIPPDLLATWLDEFWKPIVDMARAKQALTPSDTHLLLFLVDYSGHVCKTNVMFLDQPDEVLNSHAPLKLPPASKFPESELEIWLDQTAEYLPRGVNAMKLISVTEGGTPELVYYMICEFCGVTWEGDTMP